MLYYLLKKKCNYRNKYLRFTKRCFGGSDMLVMVSEISNSFDLKNRPRSGRLMWAEVETNSTANTQKICDNLWYYSLSLHEHMKKINKVWKKEEWMKTIWTKMNPHNSRITKNKIMVLGWETIRHPPYSSDLVPLDYHRSLHIYLDGRILKNTEKVKRRLSEYFD